MLAKHSRLFSLCLLLVLIGVGITAAQDSVSMTLRELADARGISIGGAVNSWELGDAQYEETVTRHFNTIALANDVHRPARRRCL
jgi:hypothetical protein